METLPSNIRKLPTYTVPAEMFVCTAIMFILLAITVITITITWIYRSCKHIHNYEYMAGHQFLVYYNKKEQQIQQEDPDGDENFLPSQKSDSKQSQYDVTAESKYKEFNRNQSRFLEFVCLSVVFAININAFSCKIFELATFVVSIICFLIFNIFRKFESVEYVRMIFLIPLLVAYVPFYIESKTLTTS